MLKNILISTISCFVFLQAYAQTDPCSSLADLTSKSNPNAFVGFGAGMSQKEADGNAQIDMASRIRQKVTATSTVTENNDSSKLEATSKSMVSEVLIGANILRRCPNNGTFSTVVTLDKNLFVSSLEKKLSYNVDKAQKLVDSINNAKSDEVIAGNVDTAKKLLAEYQTTFDSDLQLCKIYNGCVDVKNENVFSDLADLVSKQGDKDQYIMISNSNRTTKSFRNELIDLVEKDGVKVMDGVVVDHDDASVNRKIYAKCVSKVGSQIPGSTDRVVDVTCTLESYIGKQKGFRKVYSCKAMADADIDPDEAANTCSGRLQAQ